MTIQNDALAHLAKLAKIETTEAEEDLLCTEVSNIIALVDQLKKIDTTDIAPLAHPLELYQPLREDSQSGDSQSGDSQTEIFNSIAPLMEGNVYLVPPVLEVDE